MTVFRKIQISIWQDKYFLELTPLEKYFFLYLLTNSKTKQCGIYQIPKQVMLFETGLKIEEIEKFLSKFEDGKKIKYEKNNSEIMIINWLKHNRNRSRKVITCIEKELLDVKNKEYLNEFYTLCKKYQYSISAKTKKEKEIEKEEEKEKKEEEESYTRWQNNVKKNGSTVLTILPEDKKAYDCYKKNGSNCDIKINSKFENENCPICLSKRKDW